MDCIKLFSKINAHKLSKLLNIPSTTIYSWKKNGVPKWRVAAIVEACRKYGIDISDCLA